MGDVTRVLLVEDLPTDAELAEREVRRVLPGTEFLRVETRDDYLAALTSFKPDVILSDYKLPHFDGMSALELALHRVPGTPFIVVTGSMNEETAVECMKAGAWDYVIKEHIKRLGPAVKAALEQGRVRRAQRMAQDALDARNRGLLALGDGSAELSAARTEPEMYQRIAQYLKEMTGGVLAAFGVYDAVGKCIRVKHAEYDPGVDAARLMGVGRPSEMVFPVSEALYRELEEDPGGRRLSLSQATFGRFPNGVGSTPPGIEAVDRFYGIAHWSEGVLYGNSIVALRAESPDPAPELLRVYAKVVAASLSRARAEAALRQSDRLLRQTQEFARVGGWEVDVATGRRMWTDETYRIHGLSREGYDPSDLSRDAGTYENQPLLAEAFRRALEFGEPYDLELRFRNARGQDLWVRNSGAAEVKEGAVVRVYGSFMDITDRKLAEAERERLMAAIEQAGEIVTLTDLEGIVQYVNPAFEYVTGYTREEAIGMNARARNAGAQDQAFYEQLSRTISSGKTWHGTMVLSRKDGRPYTEDVTISPVHDSGGRIVSYVAVGRDITAERLLEEQLRQAQKMETVGQLAGGVAHDFNNMLQVISSYAEMSLKKVEAGQPIHKYLLEIRRAAQRSAEMTGQLLAFARKQAVSPKVLDLNEALAGTQKMVQRLIGEDIDLAWSPGHSLWKVKIDPAQLDQILTNLAVNARDAIGGAGKLTIETGNVRIDALYSGTHADSVPGEYVLLAVSDDGHGMDRETMSHLFEPFFTTKEQGKGTGLGLATVYGIVKQNNGFINVYSEPGEGSTFSVYLPRAEGAADEQGTDAEPAAPRGGRETVLVVEDEAAILSLAKESLEELGYTVLTAGSPEEALRKAGEREGPIQLLVTDVVMPGMNGRELAGLLGATRPGMKCLYMSGYTADVIARRGVLEEGLSFIGKPFSLTVLAEKVRGVLDG